MMRVGLVELDLKYIFKIEPIGLTGSVDVGYEKKIS